MGTYELNQGWLFGGEYRDGSADPRFDDSGFSPVVLPHTVVPLSWGGWEPASWEKVWIYRRHLDGSALGRGRVFAHFDGVMTSARAMLNGTQAGRHQGGYLPWSVELTEHLVPGDNVLAVIVDSRWLPVPPGGARRGARAVDYLQPGGIYRDVALRIMPDIFLSDMFARPADVLAASRTVDVRCTVDAASVPTAPATITAELLDGPRRLASASAAVEITAADVASAAAVATLNLSGIGDVTLWSPDTPKLYTVRATVSAPPSRGEAAPATHTVSVRTGFREARFEPGGFFLNGRRLQMFGLNRHQLFPYTGMAMGARLQRRDAEILRRDLNCNIVRCSHYPPSPHFLDACDELGLMVWEEPPGWQHVGDAAWQDLAVQDVRDMVTRDRGRPSVVVWATRLNETASHPRLYRRTRQAARELDGSRQTTGAMSTHSGVGWAEDVFGYDDYSSAKLRPWLRPPRAGVPYLVSEAVGALAGPPAYRWTDSNAVLAAQAFLHAQVHDIARSDTRYAGLIGWAGIDYASLNGGDRIWKSLKTPGVLDFFRVPKPGAAFYRSQVSPAVRPVILPVFGWDFGPGSPPGGPGPEAMIATNCDRLELYVGGEHYATGTPDAKRFGNLDYPPVIADLSVDGSGLPELRIDGYASGRLAASVRMSADTSLDRLSLTADHQVIEADGTDCTRVTFLAVDAYGNQRPHVTGEVRLSLTGPAVLVGDNPFPFGTYGPVGGAFVRSVRGLTGPVIVAASHPLLGRSSVRLTVIPPAAGRRFAR
ncbi:MAG: glycoside hydrolase family 2 protein [Streptosporangiaceae bacterium]